MRYEVLNVELQHEHLGIPKEDFMPTLHAYILDNSPEIDAHRARPAVLICPGGGYHFTSDREAEPVAMALLARGFQAFVLRYSCLPSAFPTQLYEVATAMAMIRERAAQWHVHPDQIAAMGFSAGGHLAGMLGAHYHRPMVFEPLGLTAEAIRPNALALCYAVTATSMMQHYPSFAQLLGNDVEHNAPLTDLPSQMTEAVPRTFLWHTANDTVVPIDHALTYASKMRELNRPFELHIYEQGAHGLSLSTRETSGTNDTTNNAACQGWIDLAAAFLHKMKPCTP